MVYEKKIEPLARYEVFLSGFLLQMWIIFMSILPMLAWHKNDCASTFLNGDVSSIGDMEDSHDCMMDHRSGMLGGAACLLLGYPFIIGHLYYQSRVMETLLSFLNSGLFQTLYLGSWFIGATILCTITPGMIIFLSYYDWQFQEDDAYVGYAIQFQFLHFTQILNDCLIIPLGIAGALPWVYRLCIMLGMLKSSHYKLSQDVKTQLMGEAMGCRKCRRYFFIILCLTLIMVILFGSFADVFDYEKDGFFSYHGDSQYLKITLLIAWEIQALQTMLVSCRIKNIETVLNSNVQSMSQQDSMMDSGNSGL